jgi:hypothetical protein
VALRTLTQQRGPMISGSACRDPRASAGIYAPRVRSPISQSSWRILEGVHIPPHVCHAVLTQEALNLLIECIFGFLAAKRLSITLELNSKIGIEHVRFSPGQHPCHLLRDASRRPCTVLNVRPSGTAGHFSKKDRAARRPTLKRTRRVTRVGPPVGPTVNKSRSAVTHRILGLVG